jgi:uncharacterized SAM-binding protein YcdF (DUF218 family)
VEWQIVNSIAALLLPPGCLIALAVVGALAARWRPRLGRALVALAVVALYVLSTPFAADRLLAAYEPVARNPLEDRSGRAIVVLGGGAYFAAPEYGRDTVGTFTLARLRYAAYLQGELKVPILVSGGAPRGTSTEAELMEQVLASEFRTPVRWLEKVSHNTLENARLSYRVLSPESIRRVYLVTHAWHMPRARLAFERSGFSVIPAATAYTTLRPPGVTDFLPAASALSGMSWLFHEVIGSGWYHLRLFLGR